MLNEKNIRSSRPFFPEDDIRNITLDISDALREGILRNGKNLRDFERSIAEYLLINNTVAMDSDSSAFETALSYLGAKNHEVIVCTNSFISVPNSVLYSGGKVVFADIHEDTLSMDPSSLQENISEETRGVIVTHIAGFPNPDLKKIIEICKDNDLFLIEDATHSIGATLEGKKTGTFGDAAVFAFTPTKVMTTGEGGMLVTNNDDLAEYSRRYSYYGSGPGKTNFANLGRHMMMPEISAILGLYQLRRIEEFISRRNKIADMYNEKLDRIETVRTVKCSFGSRSSYYKYPVVLDHKIDKIEFTRLLFQDFNVETGTVFYPPCHLQPVYKKLGVTSYGSLLTSEEVLSRMITLPIHVGLTNENIEYILNKVELLVQRLS
jgi:perosamine synthetase